jgi:hypothetical protein
MGSIKKALKPITRVVDNIIPNEIKPALPYIAATFGAPYLSPFVGKGLASLGMKTFSNSALQAGLTKGLAGGLANIGTQALLGKNINPVSAAVSGLFAGAGPVLAGKGEFAESLGSFISPDKVGGMTLGQAATAASAPLTAGTAEAAYDAAKEAEDAYEEYLKEQEAAGNEDIQTRSFFIGKYLANAGFDQDYIDTRLNELGYAANGGLMGTRVGYRIGGGPVKSFIAKLLNAEPSEEVMQRMVEERKKEILNEMFDPEAETGAYSMQQMQEANEMATKQAMKELEEFKMRIGMDLGDPPEDSVADDMIDQIMEPREKGEFLPTALPRDMRNEEREFLPTALPRNMRKDGGIMNLNMGGMPAEMDLRGGGFVPLGAKERADDVPARLSKNEFVMTADAVRAAGGGSVNKGAKKMYDLMNKLEARV